MCNLKLIVVNANMHDVPLPLSFVTAYCCCWIARRFHFWQLFSIFISILIRSQISNKINVQHRLYSRLTLEELSLFFHSTYGNQEIDSIKEFRQRKMNLLRDINKNKSLWKPLRKFKSVAFEEENKCILFSFFFFFISNWVFDL